MVFQGSLKGVLIKVLMCFKEVERKLKGCSKDFSWVFQGSFKDVSRKIKGVLQGNFMEVLREFQKRFFKEVFQSS